MNYSNIIQLPFISIEQITFSKQNKGTKEIQFTYSRTDGAGLEK